MTYNLCVKLIKQYKAKGQTEKLAAFADKIDVYYAAGRLTDEEYSDLQRMLVEDEPAEE